MQGTDSMELESEEGFDYEFVPPLNHKYECPICLSALREPHQTSCGHRFCRNCILKWIRESNGRCPVDNETVSEQTVYPDNFAKREILALNVHCPNFKHGCNVVCELRAIKKHEDICGFVLTICPNKCGELLLKHEITNHLKNHCKKRQVHCEYCSDRIEADCKESHLSECPRMSVTCNYCSVSLTRCEMVQHLKEDCPKVVIPCLFSLMGCKAETKRTDMKQHMESSVEFHVKLAGEALSYLLQRGHSSIQGFDLNHLAPLMTSPNTQTLQTLMNYPSGNVDALSSNLQLLSTADSGLVTTTSSLSSDSIRSLPSSNMAGAYTSVVAVAAPSKSTHPSEGKLGAMTMVYTDSCAGSELLADSVTNTHEELINMQKEHCASCKRRTEELQDRVRKLECKIEDERLDNKKLKEALRETEARSSGGVKIWPIREYSRLRREAQNGQTAVLHSDGFYTSFYGYKICLRINLNGVDSSHGTHLSLFIHFMKGDYDDFLDWPFSGKIVLSILDQNEISDQRRHMTEYLMSKPKLAAFQKPVTTRNHKGFGYMEFVPLSVIDNSTLVKNDTLIIKAVVTVSSGES